MRSVVVVVGVAIVFVVSASPLPEIFQNYIALYGNSLQCQTQSNLGENRKDTTTRNCLLKWVPSPEMISQRKIAEFLGYPHPPSHHTQTTRKLFMGTRGSHLNPTRYFGLEPFTVPYTNLPMILMKR